MGTPLGRVFKQGGPVLLLPSLHPVAIDVEGTAVDQTANESIFIREETDSL